jgi:chemotaxis protein histidine kinase CheA
LLLEGARTAIAEVEIAGGARAADLGKSTALLHDADVALDRILAVDPRHSDAVPLRARVTTLRGEVLKEEERRAEARREEERREAQAAAARKESEAAELRRAEEERRAAEKAERDRKAEEDRAAEEERRAAEKAERDRKAEEDRAAEKARLEKEKKERAARKTAKETPAPAPPSPPAPADSRKIAEFEKGLAKQRRLVQQGKAREAADIQKILKSESESDPQLRDLYAAAFPEIRGGGSSRGLVWGGIAAVVVVGAAGLWFAVGGRSEQPRRTPPPQTAAPVVREVPPEPTFKPPETPAVSPPPIPVSAPVPPSEPAQFEPRATPPPSSSKPSPAPVPRPSPPAQKPVVAPPKAPAVTPEAPKAPAPVPETAGRIQACLKLASGQPAGAGYTVGFSINGVEKETRPTNASGCASLDVEIDLAARFQPVYAKSPSGESLVVKRPPAIRIHRGETVTKDVEILP